MTFGDSKENVNLKIGNKVNYLGLSLCENWSMNDYLKEKFKS